MGRPPSPTCQMEEASRSTSIIYYNYRKRELLVRYKLRLLKVSCCSFPENPMISSCLTSPRWLCSLLPCQAEGSTWENMVGLLGRFFLGLAATCQQSLWYLLSSCGSEVTLAG